MRGHSLDAKQARRLMKRSDVHVARAYDLGVAEVLGDKRDALLARVEEFLAGKACGHTIFALGDFRDRDRVLLMVQESC